MSDSDFLLPAQNQETDSRFRAAARSGVIVTPLVDGEETFIAMEEAIQAANRSIHIAFWFLNPATPLLSKKRKGTWAELLRAKVAEKKELVVRIILTNLDAVLQKFYHQEAWKAYRVLQAETEKLGLVERRRFQVICSRHPATIESVAEELLAGPTKTIIGELNGVIKRKGTEQAKKDFSILPGLWGNIKLNQKTKRFELAKEPRWVVFPASHHQKIVIIDGEVAFCGGMDVNSGRIDNPKHDPNRIPWHDVDCKVIGQVVDDIERNFLARWNAELSEAKAFIEEVNKIQTPFGIEPIQAEAFKAPITKPKPPTPPKAGKGETPVTAQVHRTLSVNDVFSPTPVTIRNDIQISYKNAIELAESFVYIENQYVRSTKLREWLERRAKELRVIMVVPVAPEEFSSTKGADALTEHGMFLQRTLIERLQEVFGERFGVYSMVQKKRAKKESATNAFGSAQIYVHSKVLIVDDRFASIGSANANGRGFEMDTEIALGYVGAPVRDLRVKLWTELLGTAEVANWQPKEFIAKWNAIAAANAAAKSSSLPKGRQGFIGPHDPKKFPGKENSQIPEAFTQLLDPKTNPVDEEAFA